MGSVGSDGTLEPDPHRDDGRSDVHAEFLAAKRRAGRRNDFKALWNGQTLLSFTNAANFGYKQYTYTVTATTSSSTLQFSARNDPSQWDFDNISLILPTLTSETVAISGTAAEGQGLTAKVSDSDPNAAISYQWQYENGSTWINISRRDSPDVNRGRAPRRRNA